MPLSFWTDHQAIIQLNPGYNWSGLVITSMVSTTPYSQNTFKFDRDPMNSTQRDIACPGEHRILVQPAGKHEGVLIEAYRACQVYGH